MNSPAMPPPPPPGFVYTQPKPKRNTAVIVIVAIVVAVFALMVILILATLAIPAMQSTIRRGNEVSAINNLRLLIVAEATYNATYPARGFACSLASLGGSAISPTSPDSAHFVPNDLAGGSKSGYTFTISGCSKVTTNDQAQATSYQIVAVPLRVGHTGNRAFCTDETGQIRYDPKGGTNCTEPLQ
jgi:type IV pilus assembly protein PilA